MMLKKWTMEKRTYYNRGSKIVQGPDFLFFLLFNRFQVKLLFSTIFHVHRSRGGRRRRTRRRRNGSLSFHLLHGFIDPLHFLTFLWREVRQIPRGTSLPCRLHGFPNSRSFFHKAFLSIGHNKTIACFADEIQNVSK